MKKNLEKIFASASIVVAIILIMILVITAFGGIKVEDFENDLVKGLIITLAILYFLLAATALVLMFIKSEVIKEVVIRTERGGSVRISSKVVNKVVKQACAQIEGVKCKKVILVQDDYGVRIKINVSVKDKDVVEAETYLRTLLEDMFMGEFGFKFSTIEIKVMALTPKYKPDETAIQERVNERIAKINAEKEKAVAEEAAAAAEAQAEKPAEVEAAENAAPAENAENAEKPAEEAENAEPVQETTEA